MEHVEIALNEIGVIEWGGKKHNNPEILKYATESGLKSNGTDEEHWCSNFVNWVAHKANLERSKKVSARSWLKVGLEVKEPQIGDVVIFWRGSRSSWQGHVGIFYGFTPSGKYIRVLGGNQGNAVNIKNYGKHRLLGYRRLRKLSKNPNVLRKGDRGARVSNLQSNLNTAEFNCGKVDGHFGKLTEEALLSLQRYGNLTETGIYDEASNQLLKRILNNEHTSDTKGNNHSSSENGSYENKNYSECREKEPLNNSINENQNDSNSTTEENNSDDFSESDSFDFDWENDF